jgi:5-methylthioadenosine/S-adenosylhomocysteine deaminase
MQIDTCTEDLLRDSRAAAADRRLAFTTHCSQSVNEVREMIRRHGMTPIQWADSLGLLGPGTILGHALYLDTHSWVRWHTKRDLALLGDSGSAVAHCPTPFARYGDVMESFGDYLRAGAVMGMGTDCSPHNLVEEMRKASVLARIAARDIHAVDVADFLHAATAGGATALLRDDIGRLAPGKKADLVLVDLATPQMQPARDPLRGFVYHAADRAVREVFVDGIQVVADRKVLTMNQADAAQRLVAAQERMEAAAPQRDYLRRRAEEIVPLSLPLAD